LEFLCSFEDCAATEVGEEVGLQLPPTRFRVVTATNDPMPAEDLHYVTIFAAAWLTEEEVAAVTNEEPDRCRGWAWVPWAALREGERPIFGPLQRFLDAGGPEMC
jgi:8-oxo-dGTP diphosphatase